MKEQDQKNQEIFLQNQQLIESNSQYQQILEKTNSQLGLWTNPYGIMVGSLGVLVTFLAIAATAFTIWQNQKNKKIVREELNKLFNEKQKSALELMENKGQEITEKLKTASGGEKKKLEEEKKRIKNLELEIKAGMPDFSQYMKKDDFLCTNCQSGTLHFLGNSRLLNVDIFNKVHLYGSKRKCLMCQKEFN